MKIKVNTFPPNEWRAQLKFQTFDLILLRMPLTLIDEPVSNLFTKRRIHTIRQYLVTHSKEKCQSIQEAIDSVDSLLQDQSTTVRDTISRFILKIKPSVRVVDCENWNNLFFDLLSDSAATIVPENTIHLFENTEGVSILPIEHMNVEEILCVQSKPSVPEDVANTFCDALKSMF